MNINHIWLLCILPICAHAADGHLSLAGASSSNALDDDFALREDDGNPNGDVIVDMSLAPLVGTREFADVLLKFAQDSTGSAISNNSAFRNYLKQLKTKQPAQYNKAVTLLNQQHAAITTRKGKFRSLDPQLENQIKEELMKMALQAIHQDNQTKDTTISTQGSALTRNTGTFWGTLATGAVSIAILVLNSYLTSKSNCP